MVRTAGTAVLKSLMSISMTDCNHEDPDDDEGRPGRRFRNDENEGVRKSAPSMSTAVVTFVSAGQRLRSAATPEADSM